MHCELMHCGLWQCAADFNLDKFSPPCFGLGGFSWFFLLSLFRACVSNTQYKPVLVIVVFLVRLECSFPFLSGLVCFVEEFCYVTS